jgi:hypothetical protein
MVTLYRYRTPTGRRTTSINTEQLATAFKPSILHPVYLPSDKTQRLVQALALTVVQLGHEILLLVGGSWCVGGSTLILRVEHEGSRMEIPLMSGDSLPDFCCGERG